VVSSADDVEPPPAPVPEPDHPADQLTPDEVSWIRKFIQSLKNALNI